MKIILSSLATLLLTASCANSNVGALEDAICHSNQPHTLLFKSGYEIKIFNPNNVTNPDIWEGPVCIRKTQEDSYCIKEYSLIRSVEINPSSDEAEIKTFSGSSAEIKQVKIESCQELL